MIGKLNSENVYRSYDKKLMGDHWMRCCSL